MGAAQPTVKRTLSLERHEFHSGVKEWRSGNLVRKATSPRSIHENRAVVWAQDGGISPLRSPMGFSGCCHGSCPVRALVGVSCSSLCITGSV